MKLQIIVIDLELSPRNKKLLWRTGAALAALLGGLGIAYAGLPTVWKSGDTLTADALNSNFSYLQSQISAVSSTAPAAIATGAVSLSYACASAGANAVDCTCPTGTVAISGGGWCGNTANNYLVESGNAPTSGTVRSLNAWRVNCSAAAATSPSGSTSTYSAYAVCLKVE